MPSKQRILIVGASIAGLTAATGLLQTGLCDVIVFERSSESETGRLPRNGGGIGLHEESIKILNLLGITTDFVLPMKVHEDRDRNGRIIRKGMIPFYSAFWGDVHKCLLEKSVTGGAIIHYNKNVISVTETDDGVSLRFSDGTVSLKGACAIGADGILSSVRSFMFPDCSESESDLIRHAGYYAWRGLVSLENLPEDIELIFRKGTFTIEISGKSHAILYYLPRGLNWLVYINSNSEATSTYHHRREIMGQITRTATKAELEEFYGTIESLYRPALVNLIKSSETPLPFKNQMYDREILTTYSSDRYRCVLIGDAAHPTLPHHIRGTNMAIGDGFALAKQFQHAPHSDLKNGCNLKEIFCKFEKERLKYCNDVVQLSARIGRVRQGVFSDKQGPLWDTICQNSELSEMLADVKDLSPIDD